MRTRVDVLQHVGKQADLSRGGCFSGAADIRNSFDMRHGLSTTRTGLQQANIAPGLIRTCGIPAATTTKAGQLGSVSRQEADQEITATVLSLACPAAKARVRDQ